MSSYMNRPPTSWVIYPPYPEDEAGKKKPKPKTAKQPTDQPTARRSKTRKSPKKPD